VATAAFLFFLEVAIAAVASFSPAGRSRLLHAARSLLHPAMPAEVAPAPMPGIAPSSTGAMSPPLSLAPAVPAPEVSRPATASPHSTPKEPPAPGGLARRTRPHGTAVPDAVPGEVELYSRALTKLNVEHDAEGTLAALEVYRLDHPQGVFRDEALLTQIEAELSLNRDAEALALIDALQSRTLAVPQAAQLTLLRAELLAKTRRCSEAGPLLDRYLTPGTVSSQRERALFARASCRAQLRDLDGSREDLREYLREFPHGRYVPDVLQAIGRPQ
jgi:hypothetical protein